MKRAIVISCVVLVALSGCSTREETVQGREGDDAAGSLGAAAYMAEVEKARRLMARGGDVNARLKDGGTPPFSAIQRSPRRGTVEG